MSRTLKFRAWIKSAKQWQTQENVEWTPIREIMGKGNVDDYVWMQFIGLRDKNGKEIYEGDIVRGKWASGLGGKSTRYKEFSTVVEWWRSEWLTKFPGDWNYRFYPTWEELEVIGNIYENPELLKEVK